ncbi:MAP3K epsilon protein kinase 1 isoform X3 [Physcomitrium patens]|uniref:non-specific serine/threonine protein kinase n=1 Tax=Physcomitrium patens TaxID=3218 RepID=A0A7I4AYR3_PHYPA|nr:MAP3K epsilon protein kinase 1-like isoform X2 [Physcomitrium patens]|eukprot:XP_024396492.1 MAP3K epsilon protein kinase 1-like isoform X2 [Physcomitrella patens]
MSRHGASHFHKSKTLNDKYLLGDEIGKGAYGRVYKGLDLDNGDFVAIKQVSLENIPSEDLASIMNLNHRNIVKYQGSFKTKTHLYIILEFVENGSLASIIKPNKFGAFPESLVAVYIAQVLEGLVYLHEQGVIHRDIKGANILTTKEGLVKLADFGVATKLTEADINTHSVVGTPYWMAPEVIEMSGVSAASDIWSVGCTVIELLTCIPPYYELQPMPALYRIVQDPRPPLPEHVSDAITDFLLQCFQKDAKLRPDAKTLLNHPWLRNSRRNLQSTLDSNIPEVVSTVVERTIEEQNQQNAPGEQEESLIMRDPFESCSEDDLKIHSPTMSNEASAASSSQSSISRRALIRIPRHAVSHLQRLSGSQNSRQPEPTGNDLNKQCKLDPITNLHPAGGHVLAQVESPDSVTSRPEIRSALEMNGKAGLAGEPLHDDMGRRWVDNEPISLLGRLHLSGNYSDDHAEVKNLMEGKKEDIELQLEPNGSLFNPEGLTTYSGSGGQLGVYKDLSLDGLMEDFMDDSHGGEEEASTSAPSNAPPPGNSVSFVLNRSRLKSQVSQKQLKSDVTRKSNPNSFKALIIADENEFDIGELGFETNAQAREYFAKQASEFTRLMGMVKLDEPEEAVIPVCQRLVLILREFPNQKSRLMSRHGLIPLMDMLETSNNRVLYEVLRVINHVIQDHVELQENACLIGLVPVVTSFASTERSRDIRMEVSNFVRQLCHTSATTLQMFISCRGLPVLVGFLEPDYAKYREMVHMAIDGMWQVFDLQSSTSKNDFCRIFAKSGVLVRLVNTLHNLNEVIRAGLQTGASSTTTTTAENHVYNPTDNGAAAGASDVEMHKLLPGQPHKSTALPDYLRHLPGQVELHTRGHSGQLDQAKAAALDNWRQHAAGTNPFLQLGDNILLSDYNRFGKEDDARSNGDSSRPLIPAETSWAVFEPVHRNGHAPADPSSQATFFSLWDKDYGSKFTPGRPDHVRHPSDRSDSALPLLHHAQRRNGSFDSYTTDLERDNASVEMAGLTSTKTGRNARLSPSPSGRLDIQGFWNAGEPATNVSALTSQSASSVLSSSGHPNARFGSTASSGLLARMQSALSPDEAREYTTKVSDLLVEFSAGDAVVKSFMCGLSLLIRLFQMLNKLEAPILVKILRCINQLSTEPNTLEALQRADAIKHLVPFLEHRDGLYADIIQNEVLSSLHNLCKINKRRQEQAAESGIIPHLMHFILSDSPLKHYALPLLCDMAHASRYTREQLRAYKGLDIYLNLLDDKDWAVTAIDSLAVCLAHDNEQRKVESLLLKQESILKLVEFFRSCGGNSFVQILEPFLKMITKSVRLNTALAVSGLTPLIVGRLDHKEAIARLLLLKMIKVVYEHHPRPKQLIAEHDLPSRLQKLIEERRDGERTGGQVLVKQVATALMKALHINTAREEVLC